MAIVACGDNRNFGQKLEDISLLLFALILLFPDVPFILVAFFINFCGEKNVQEKGFFAVVMRLLKTLLIQSTFRKSLF